MSAGRAKFLASWRIKAGLARIRTARTVRYNRRRVPQENVHAWHAEESSYLTTAVRQLHRSKHAAQGSYQYGLSFAELSRKVLVVRVGNREGITGTGVRQAVSPGILDLHRRWVGTRYPQELSRRQGSNLEGKLGSNSIGLPPILERYSEYDDCILLFDHASG